MFMKFSLSAFVLDNLESAGAIGGYVSISIIGFAIISYITKKKYDKLTINANARWLHPIIGAILGIIPGCGATIVVASLYKNKKISFGGLFATFISTLGEGSFVLLGASDEADVSGNLKAYLIITIIGLFLGIILGYLFDYFGYENSYKNTINDYVEDKTFQKKQNTLAGIFIEKIGFYIILLMAFFLAPTSILALWGGAIDAISDATYLVSIALTITCIIYYFINILIYKYHDCSVAYSNIKSTILHAVIDVAMVVSYVFIGLFITNFVIDYLVGADTFDVWMRSSKYVIVLLAALIGAIPGCGGMIAVAVAFITIPNFPIAALIAAAISTSGDGIFPLLAENKKDGLIVTIFGFLAGLAVGYLVLVL